MPDPIHDLESLGRSVPTGPPLPAAEVRRRGDRLRRRNTAVTAVAGVAAATALIATPLAVVADRGTDSGPPPAGQTQWLREVPEEFPLAEGMPERNGHDGSPVEVTESFELQQPVRPCGQDVWDLERPEPVVDTAQAVYTGESEGGIERGLALYADDDAARTAMGALVDAFDSAVDGCPTPADGPESARLPSALGEESLVYVDHYRLDGDVTGEAVLHQVVRVGNALLLGSTYFMGGGDETVVRDTADDFAQASATTVTAMCVFAADPCDLDRVLADERASGVIPDDFPLLDGLPADDLAATEDFGRFGPDRAMPPVEIAACGVTHDGMPAPDDSLRAAFRNPDQGYERQLMTFASDGQARAWFDGAMALFRACPRDTDDRGVTKVYDVVEGPGLSVAADDAGSAVMRVEVDGEAGLGLQVVQVLRVGRSVLLVRLDEEGNVVRDQAQSRSIGEDVLADSAAVVGAMRGLS